MFSEIVQSFNLDEDLDSKNVWAWNFTKCCILKNLDPYVLGFPLSKLTKLKHEKKNEMS